MGELITAFVTLLTAAGIRAVGAMPGEPAPHLTEAAVAVSVRRMETSPIAYLGLSQGQEVYGQQLTGEVCLCVVSPADLGAGTCRSTMDSVLSAIAGGVAGVSLLSLTAEAPEYREDCMEGMITLSCRCWLYETAAQGTESPISQFLLKGALA